MISALLAVFAAASNALASVLQRQALRSAPASETFRLRLMWDLVRRKVWLGGIAALIAGFLFQAVALSFGSLSLVQPILITELPFTMFLVALLFGIGLSRECWLAVGLLTSGLCVLLVAAAPDEGHRYPGRMEWMIATIVTVAVVGYLVTVARSIRGGARAAVLGVASGLGFSFTAALMKEATRLLPRGAAVLLTSWQVYAMVGAGLISLFLLQLALENGTLVAVQPALNVSDPVASIAYGVGLFGETIRLGAWSLLELLGVGLILYGSTRLAASPPIRVHTAELKPTDP